MSDVIDYDEFLNGSRSEGAFSVFATLIPKFVAIPASAIPLAVINLLGFNQPIAGVAQNQPKQVESFIQVSFVMLPFSCAVLSFLIKFLYPIKADKTHRREGAAKGAIEPRHTGWWTKKQCKRMIDRRAAGVHAEKREERIVETGNSQKSEDSLSVDTYLYRWGINASTLVARVKLFTYNTCSAGSKPVLTWNRSTPITGA